MMSLERCGPDHPPVSALAGDDLGFLGASGTTAAQAMNLGQLARRVPGLVDRVPLIAVPLSAEYWYGLRSLPVIDHAGAPAGILRRDDLMAWLREDDGWVTLDRPHRVGELARRPRAIWQARESWGVMLDRFRKGQPSAGDECLIVDDEGRYAGIVTAIDLLRRAALPA